MNNLHGISKIRFIGILVFFMNFLACEVSSQETQKQIKESSSLRYHIQSIEDLNQLNVVYKNLEEKRSYPMTYKYEIGGAELFEERFVDSNGQVVLLKEDGSTLKNISFNRYSLDSIYSENFHYTKNALTLNSPLRLDSAVVEFYADKGVLKSWKFYYDRSDAIDSSERLFVIIHFD